MKTLYSISTLLLLLLAGCKVSQDIAVPEPVLPESYRGSFSRDTTSIATIPWRQFFSEPELQQLIDQALLGNYDLQGALKNIEISSRLLGQSKWGQVPQLGAYVGASSTIPSENSLNGLSINNFLGKSHIEDYNAALTLSWEADIWGKISNRKKEALAVYLQSEESRKAIQSRIVAHVAQGYYSLQMLDTQLEIAKKNEALSQHTLRILQYQFEAGQVTTLAVEQAQAQLLKASQIIPAIEKEIVLQENALSVLAGILPTGISRGKTAALLPSDYFSAGLPSVILRNRPDIKSLEYELNAANARVGVAKAYLYPALNITASGGLSSFKADNWFNMPASLFGILAGSVAQPLLQGKKLRTQFEVEKLEREKAVISFREQVLVGVGEVSDALIQIKKTDDQLTLAKTRVQHLQKAVGNADQLFSSGLANYLEVITAQNNALESELEYALIQRNRLSAQVNLYKALGGGWK